MPYLFGMYIPSKEEQEKEYQDYARKIFPHGDRQKAAIQSLLKELLPKEAAPSLLLYFIQLKEQLIGSPSLSPSEADASLPRHILRPRSPEGKWLVFALLDADIKMDSSLSYPSASELIEAAERRKNT